MLPLLPALLTAVQAVTPAAPGAILLDRSRIDRAPPPIVVKPAETRPATVDAAAPGVVIRGIRFTGAKAPAPVAVAARRFLGQRADGPTLSKLAAALSDAYGDSRVALYSIAIPAQTFDKGVVTVALTEGRIARAQVVSADPLAHAQLKGRMGPLMTPGPLPRDRFERQFTLMRAVPGLTVHPDFADPEGTGALVLTVTPKQKKRRITGGFNNRGPSLLGDGQFDVRAEFYGVGVDGDQATLAASAASNLQRYRFASAGYLAPVGSSGLTASGSAAYLETRPRRTGIPGGIKGTAKQANAALSYPLVRDFHRSVDVSLGIDGVNSDNAAFGRVIADERSRAARVSISAAEARERRSGSASIAFSQGLDLLGARVDAPLAQTGFIKANVAVAASQAIGKRAAVRLSGSAQWTNDRLPAAERFAVGGEALGRAFDTALLTGDRGGGAVAELAYRPLASGRFAASELYGFADAAQVTVLERGPLPGVQYSLGSAGVGVRARYRDKAELGLEAGWVTDRPFPGYTEDWRVSLGWRLSL